MRFVEDDEIPTGFADADTQIFVTGSLIQAQDELIVVFEGVAAGGGGIQLTCVDAEGEAEFLEEFVPPLFDQAAGGLWSRLWWAGNVTIFAVGIVASAFWGALAQDDVIDSASDGLINALMALDSITFFVCGQWAYFVFGAAAAVVYCRSRSLPTWLGVVSGIAAVLAPVSGLWIVFDDNSYGPWGALGIPSMLLGVVFYVATSIMLIRRSSIA